MKNYSRSVVIKTGLAIFAMLFGSANLMFPIKIGIISGNKTWLGVIGFILSGILIPVAGLISMVLFNGDYKAFFHRIGKIPGNIFIFFCILLMGPMLAMPRIMTFSYSSLAPFLPGNISLLTFSIIFAIATFLFSYKKSSVLDSIGKILSPLLLISLTIIFILGLIFKENINELDTSSLKVFYESFLTGYNTLDLLGVLFFAYIAISILYSSSDKSESNRSKNIVKTMLYSSLIASSLLTIVYSSLAYLGSWYGTEFAQKKLDLGQIFINTILQIVGTKGTIIVSITVMLACLTTIIALSSIVGEYLKNEVLNKKINYIASLIIVLLTSVSMAQFSLDKLLIYSEPIINIMYPGLITLTFCNLAYKLWGFKPVKIPVLLTLILSSLLTLYFK